MNIVHAKYDDIKQYINEGDVLLFRGNSLISTLIGAVSESSYTHVALASWVNGNSNTSEGILECVEFREGSPFAGKNGRGGGRAINLDRAVSDYPGIIDVYRPSPVYIRLSFDFAKNQILKQEIKYNGKAITRVMRKMTGLPYGWRRILWLLKYKLFRVTPRLFNDNFINKLMHDEVQDIVYPVCSTAVSYCFNTIGYDLVRNKSDEFTEPGNIAQSSSLNYLFTLMPNNYEYQRTVSA